MFRALCAHHQEVKIVLHSIWYCHTCRWLSRAQVENLCIKLVNYQDLKHKFKDISNMHCLMNIRITSHLSNTVFIFQGSGYALLRSRGQNVWSSWPTPPMLFSSYSWTLIFQAVHGPVKSILLIITTIIYSKIPLIQLPWDWVRVKLWNIPDYQMIPILT